MIYESFFDQSSTADIKVTDHPQHIVEKNN